jgi:hypothetical protein
MARVSKGRTAVDRILNPMHEGVSYKPENFWTVLGWNDEETHKILDFMAKNNMIVKTGDGEYRTKQKELPL